jgi:Tfp pilus assembly protein PilV
MLAKKRTQRGFTMIEVLISTFLVILGLLVIMSSMVAMAKSSRYSQRMDVANSLARREMERIHNMTFANIVNETGNYGEYAEYPGYRHQTAVSTVGTVKQVQLDIYFEGDRRRAEVITYVANM